MAEERKMEFAGNGVIKKCPNCGAQLEAFQARCPACGFAIGGEEKGGSAALKNFFDMYTSEKDNARKLEMINTFPIPNTIEDTIEFAILAVQQIKSYAIRQKKLVHLADMGSLSLQDAWSMSAKGTIKVKENDLNIAWKNKLEQVCQRAKIAYPQDRASLEHLDMLVKDAEKAESGRKKAKIIFFAALIVLFVLIYVILVPKMYKSTKNITHQLEIQMSEILTDIEEGNYDAAEVKLLDFNVSYMNDSWKEKKEFLKKRLEAAREKAGE